MHHFFVLLKRELAIAFTHKAMMLQPILFFMIAVTLVPLSISTQNTLLQEIGIGYVWLALLLASMLSLPLLWEEDYKEGCLEYMLLKSSPSLIMLTKCITHWLTTAFPLLCVTPVAGILLGLSASPIFHTLFALLLGTPTLSSLGMMTTILTLGSHKSATLITLLTIPFTIPVLIFGSIASSTTEPTLQNQTLLILLGIGLIMIPLCIVGSAFALRTSLIYK